MPSRYQDSVYGDQQPTEIDLDVECEERRQRKRDLAQDREERNVPEQTAPPPSAPSPQPKRGPMEEVEDKMEGYGSTPYPDTLPQDFQWEEIEDPQSHSETEVTGEN